MSRTKNITAQVNLARVERNIDVFAAVGDDLNRRCRDYLHTQDDAFIVNDTYPGDPFWKHRGDIYMYYNSVRKQQLLEQIKYLRRKLSELSKSIEAFPEIRL